MQLNFLHGNLDDIAIGSLTCTNSDILNPINKVIIKLFANYLTSF